MTKVRQIRQLISELTAQERVELATHLTYRAIYNTPDKTKCEFDIAYKDRVMDFHCYDLALGKGVVSVPMLELKEVRFKAVDEDDDAGLRIVKILPDEPTEQG